MLPELTSCKDAERLMTPEQRARNRDPTSAAIRWAIEQVHRSVVEAWLCSYASHANKLEPDHDELIRRMADTVRIQRLTYALWFYIDTGDDPRNAVGPMSYPDERRAKELLEAALQLVSRPDPVVAAVERAPIGPPESEQERRLMEEALASGPGIPGEVVSAELAERGRRVVRAALERVICIDPVAFTGDAATGFQSSIHDKGARLFRLGSGPTREACQMEARRIVDVLALALPDALTEAELREREGVTEQASRPAEAVPPALDLSCSFCAKTQQQVKKLVTGPWVHICNECVELCNDIMQSEEPDPAPGTPPSVVAEDDSTVALALMAKGNPVILQLQAQAREQGREEGRMEGEAKGLRTAVRLLCRVLSIPLSAERESDLARMEAAELDALCERIQHDQHGP